MADNIAITAGSGTIVSTEEVTTLNGGVVSAQHVQRMGLSTITADGTVLDVKSANPLPVAGTATEVHLGEVGSPCDVVTVTLTLDTSAYVSGDLLADTQAIASAVRVSDGRCILQSINVHDEDAQAQPFDLVFLSSNTSLGTENSAPTITDANGRNILGVVSVVAADYVTISGFSEATLRNVGLLLEAASGTSTVYVAAVTRGTPTHTATGIQLRFGFLWS